MKCCFQFQEFKNYAHHSSLKDCPKLERSIALFNGLTQWVQCMVLSKTTPQQRADVVCKFVSVAKVRKLNAQTLLLTSTVQTKLHISLVLPPPYQNLYRSVGHQNSYEFVFAQK